MLNSKGVCSNRGPLWVAAFCFKKLKKAQVFETDICSSVANVMQLFSFLRSTDKILHEEMDVVSHRVLAYLLHGVVRIYSKKVEYLLHDCNDVVTKINKFAMDTMVNAPVEALRMTVTIPDSLELDAIDVDLLEDSGRYHIAPMEEITLKEVLYETEGLVRFSQEKFEDFDLGGNTCFADFLMAEDGQQSHLMNMNIEILPTTSPINSPACKDICLNSISSQKEPLNFDTMLVVEGIQSRISQGESMDSSMFSGREKEAVLSIEASIESCQVDREHNMAKETPTSSCQMHHEIVEVNDARRFQKCIERPQDDQSYQKESVHNGKSSVVKESWEELTQGSTAKHNKEGKLELQEKVSLEDGTSSVIPAKLINLDVTPQSNSKGGSIGRPKPGAATSEFLLISTPAIRDCARFSRKRKCFFDEMTVLSTEVYRKSLHDASDLISNRKRIQRTLPAIRRKSHISRLPNGFYESLLPCYSSELQSLFSAEKLKIPVSLENVETQQKLDVSESRTFGGPEHIETAPQNPSRCSDPHVHEETSNSTDHIATAPETPPLCQNVKAWSMRNPERTEVHNKDNLGPLSSHTRRENVQSMESNNNLMEELIAKISKSYEILESEQFFNLDEDLDLMNEEEINSCDMENSNSLPGWSERTRKVARFLHNNFLDQRKQREGDVVNLSQVTGGRTRKECARLFSEMLVLKTTSYVDVKQNNAYGDIAIRKLPKLDQTFGVGDL